ncbi:succinate receptor 1-like [Engraulis encrasicolus]|uniref:succinate receptor 1-like n=1 Tax=Engraulis encrasicolus TaxID=184585 RepID=UPI002FD0F6A7
MQHSADSSTMNDSCLNLDDDLMRYYLSPIYALEFTLGFLGNLVVVVGYPLCLQKWRSTNIYLYNLAVSDIICVCTLPRLSYLYAHGMRELHPVNCVLNRYLLFVNMYSSILFMALVSLDRYLLIRYPRRNHVLLTTRTAGLASALTWLLVNVEITPFLYYAITDIQMNLVCQDFASLSRTWGFLSYSVGLMVFGYMLPLVVLFWSTYKIGSLLRAQEESFARRSVAYRRPLRIVQAAAYMFLLLYLPYHIMRNVRILTRLLFTKIPKCTIVKIEAAYIVMRPLPFLHSVINPVFYFMMTDQFRELLLARFVQLKNRITGKR